MKRIIKLFFIVFFMPISAFAATEFTLRTPRGTDVPVIFHRSTAVQSRTILVLAPGQSCNYKNNLFERIGEEGDNSDIAIVRFEWSYCSQTNPNDREPSQDLSTEREDFQTVLTFAQSFTFGDSKRIIIGGKSLGSIVAYQIFSFNSSIQSLLLLTPVCSYTKDADLNPLPKPIELGEENYPLLKNETRPILLALGNRDPLCLTPLLYDFLKTTQGNVSTLIGIGDHGFRTKNAQNEVDETQTRHNINSIMPAIFNWIRFYTR